MGALEIAIIIGSTLFFFIILYYVIKSAVTAGIKASGVSVRLGFLSRVASRHAQAAGVEKAEIDNDFQNALSE